jgi:hypothetical protein
MKSESKTLAKLNAQRAELVGKIALIDVAIKAENKKIKEAAHRDALALLHKSGVLDDPDRLRELLAKSTGDSRNEAKPSPVKPALDLPTPTGAGVMHAATPEPGHAQR